ncbi:MAG TPA: hypothetical protein VF794_19805 [Archangium sp.]|jgi:hypothetical protein|uniref:hypothetical protein n=1 Tax=Archangium sp. TaxID=1872627 RepID=UPI002EDB8728
MRHTMKMTLAALASLALLPTAVSAHTVKGPHPGTVLATTYYSSGSFHGAVDIASGASCNSWGVETGVVGSVYWNVTIQSTTTACVTSSGSGNGNEARHHWADGWTFRVWHFVKTAASVDKTCDRCQVGDEGEHTHFHQDKSGTKDTSWYSGYTTKGEAVDRTETIGVLD